MRLILILIALTIALPISLSQAAQLCATRSEVETDEAKAVKSSSVKAANDLMRADAEPWLSSRMRGLPVTATAGEPVGQVDSLVMNGTAVTAVKLSRPNQGSVVLPYSLFERGYTGVEPALKLAVSLERALDEQALAALNEAGARLGPRAASGPTS